MAKVGKHNVFKIASPGVIHMEHFFPVWVPAGCQQSEGNIFNQGKLRYSILPQCEYQVIWGCKRYTMVEILFLMSRDWKHIWKYIVMFLFLPQFSDLIGLNSPWFGLKLFSFQFPSFQFAAPFYGLHVFFQVLSPFYLPNSSSFIQPVVACLLWSFPPVIL